MKVLVVSDKVNNFLYSEHIKKACTDVDLIISCGDLPIQYLEYIETMLNKPLLYVVGNHAPYLLRRDNVVQHAPMGCQNIDGQVVHVKGLLVAGLEGSMRYNRGQHQYSEWQMWCKIQRLKMRFKWNCLRHGRALDILVTHAPPFGIHDGTDLCHRGFKAFNKIIQRYQPNIMFHGHTHPNLYDSKPVQLGRTQILNIYGYKIIEIENGRNNSTAGGTGF